MGKSRGSRKWVLRLRAGLELLTCIWGSLVHTMSIVGKQPGSMSTGWH